MDATDTEARSAHAAASACALSPPAGAGDTDARRFGGVARLFGAAGAAAIGRAHVAVVGVGGVGSWAAEALARSGVGALTLVDLDHVAESNVNRQIHALESTLGMAKVEAMRARIADIAPRCVVHAVDAFVTRDEVAALLPGGLDWVIDAIDQVGAKAALIAHCRARGMAVVTCGAAGGRTDPLRLRQADLSRTTGDALLAAVRADLRRRHGFARAPSLSPAAKGFARASRAAEFGVPAIFSDEPPPVMAGGTGTGPAVAGEGDEGDPSRMGGAGGTGGTGAAPLGCAGYGSIVTVTAPMGLAAAALVLRRLAGDLRP